MLIAHHLNVKLLTRESSVHYWECEEDEDAPPAMMLGAAWICLVLNLHHTAQLQLLPKLTPGGNHLHLQKYKFLQQSQAIDSTAENMK